MWPSSVNEDAAAGEYDETDEETRYRGDRARLGDSSRADVDVNVINP